MPLHSAKLPAHIASSFQPPKELLARKDTVIPQLYDWQAKVNPNYPVFVYEDDQQLKYITYGMAKRAIDRAARFVLSRVGSIGKEADSNPPVVAIFANAGMSFL